MEPSSPQLVVVFGLPGTGKTTLARALAAELDYLHFNTDGVRRQLQKRDHYSDADKAAVYEQLLDMIFKALESGQGVVADATFSRESHREKIRQIAAKAGAPLKWIQTTAAEAAVRTRVSEKRPDSQADFQVYQKIRAEFEPFRSQALEVKTDRQSLDTSLAQILQYLKE